MKEITVSGILQIVREETTEVKVMLGINMRKLKTAE